MKALYRLGAAVLTIASALICVELVKAVTSGDSLNVGYFALFCVIAALALGSAFVLWARAGGPR
ncbi:MAG: hypothetical protein JWM71_1645 [Solirubrobacteraceae bacterium]|nr:hypothetical protein [Solirubrobacteraceae bacterium]